MYPYPPCPPCQYWAPISHPLIPPSTRLVSEPWHVHASHTWPNYWLPISPIGLLRHWRTRAPFIAPLAWSVPSPFDPAWITLLDRPPSRVWINVLLTRGGLYPLSTLVHTTERALHFSPLHHTSCHLVKLPHLSRKTLSQIYKRNIYTGIWLCVVEDKWSLRKMPRLWFSLTKLSTNLDLFWSCFGSGRRRSIPSSAIN